MPSILEFIFIAQYHKHCAFIITKHGVIRKAERLKWASPIVVVPKADKSVKICGDYKVTINQSPEDEQYPLPTTQDLYTALIGSEVFSRLVLSHAYTKLGVHKKSEGYLITKTLVRDYTPTPRFLMGSSLSQKFFSPKWINSFKV